MGLPPTVETPRGEPRWGVSGAAIVGCPLPVAPREHRGKLDRPLRLGDAPAGFPAGRLYIKGDGPDRAVAGRSVRLQTQLQLTVRKDSGATSLRHPA